MTSTHQTQFWFATALPLALVRLPAAPLVFRHHADFLENLQVT